MKKLCISLIPLLLLAASSWAVTVQVGSGADTTPDLPLGALYGYSYSQQIYTQEQIATAGTITKIRFYLSSGTPVMSSSAWVVYLGHTTKTGFANTSDWVPVGSLTQVFSGNVSFPVSNGVWMEIALYTPFVYNNTDNLVVAVDENATGFAWEDVYWSNFTSGVSTGLYFTDDDINPDPASPQAGLTTSGINQIQFEIVPPGGPANPSAFNAVPVSLYQVNLSWSLNGGGNPVMLVWNTTNSFGSPVNGTPYGVGATIPGGGTVLQNNTGTSFNHTSLTPATTYFYRAFSVDATNTYSIGIYASATTLCDIAPQINENFEQDAIPPVCWSIDYWSLINLASANGTGTGSVLANFYGAYELTTYDLISPEFNTANTMLSFDHAYAAYDQAVDQLIIQYSVDGGSTYTTLVTLDGGTAGPLNTGGSTADPFIPLASQWDYKSYSLPPGTNKVKFHAISDYGNNLYLDNISISNLCTWTGAVSSDWNVPANWACGEVPVASVFVLIPALPPEGNYPIIGQGITANCFKINVEVGATVTVENGGTLNVSNP